MKFPRISTRSLMSVLVVVALDCLVYRSFAARPAYVANDEVNLTLALLPMANLLAILIAQIVRGGVGARPFRLGFVLGGLIGLGLTFLGFERGLSALGRALEGTSFDVWVSASPIVEAVVGYAILMGVPLTFQVILGLAVGGIVSKAWRSTPVEGRPEPRRPLAAFLVLVILLAVPVVVIEIQLQSKLDPRLARRPAGFEAVVEIPEEYRFFKFKKGSKLIGLEGTRVRVEQDEDASVPELTATEKGTLLNDRRAVRVTLLDGDRAGQSLGVPHCFLKPFPH